MESNMIETKTKILVIDDNQVDRELSTMMLQENGFDVLALSTAAQCLDVIVAEKPNLLLLDIMMPDVDGNQALLMIRRKFTQLELPIIMVTSKSDASDVIEALKNGANDYVAKPVQFEVAIKRIQAHVAMAAQSKVMAEAKELGAIHAMITTYKHEINNPLMIAVGNLSLLKKKYLTDPEIAKLETALHRIAEIIRKSQLVLEKGSVEYEAYAKTMTMINLNNEK